MPRRNRRQRDLDFEIHQDPPTPSADTNHQHTDTDIDAESEARDFATALQSRRFSDDGYDNEAAARLLRGMNESSLTKASTLVNETAGDADAEPSIDAMLDDLEAEKEKLAAAAAAVSAALDEDRGEITEEDETFGGEMEPDEKAVMEPEWEGTASRRESGVSAASSHKSMSATGESRRTSGVSASSRASGHDEAQPRRESGVSSTSHKTGTSATGSRRESAMSSMSGASKQSSTHPEDELEPSGGETETEAEPSAADVSLHEEDAEETASRRESTASGLTHDQYTETSESRRESTASGNTYDYTEDSASRRESGYSAVSRSDASDMSASRRDSGVSEAPSHHDRRTSGRTEALIQQAARDIISEIEKQKSSLPSPSEAAEEQSTRASSRAASVRPSDGHVSVKDDQSVRSSSRFSARASDAQASVRDDHSERSSSRMSNARPSDAHASVRDDESVRSSSRMSTARQSNGRASVKDNHSVRSESRTSARSSHGHGSVRESRGGSTSGSRPPSARPSDMHTPVPDHLDASVVDDEEPAHGSTVDEAEDNNSSQNEHDDDVFSDHSPRSSVGSVSEAEHRKLMDTVTHRSRSTRSPRISDFSRLEDDQDEEDFIPTLRGTPRPAFRSPSQIRALQMSSPPPSVMGSPRSSKRTPLPTVSRVGSPMSNVQFSPKKTPPRFKRNTPPLVLLHVTLLPLQWPWGHVLENAHPDDLSQGAKNVRDNWRQLQERMGDTTCERGILLPHPQEDFEVLEERLLEALELPLRRRARILECGHYLGPSNEMTLGDESDTEDEYSSTIGHDHGHRRSRSSGFGRQTQTHWCATCETEIRYDALGPGKVFRIKIYASNGLMKAGAWEACWKEMERVDVELEPIVEPAVQDEISQQAVQQEKAMELHQPEDMAAQEDHDEDEDEDEDGHDDRRARHEEPDASYLEHESSVIYNAPSSPPPETRVMVAAAPVPSMQAPPPSSPPPTAFQPHADEERRWRDEQRMREIYGHAQPDHGMHSMPPQQPPSSSHYGQHQTPVSPSAEAYARREERRHPAGPGANPKGDSLADLLLEAFKVMMQDRKNVMIALMSVLVLVLAVRTGGATSSSAAHREAAAVMYQPMPDVPEVATVTVTEREAASVVPSVESLSSSTSAPAATQAVEQEKEVVVSEKIVRVVETVTEVSMKIETATVTATETATETLAAMEKEKEKEGEGETVEAVHDVVQEKEDAPTLDEAVDNVQHDVPVVEKVEEAQVQDDLLDNAQLDGDALKAEEVEPQDELVEDAPVLDIPEKAETLEVLDEAPEQVPLATEELVQEVGQEL